VLLACGWIGLGQAAARAEAPASDLHNCVHGAFASDAAARASSVETTFFLKGDGQVYSQAYPAKQCLGFMAAGARNVQALELVLRSEEGRVLARSEQPSALAFLQHCGEPSEMVFATVRVADGQGEVVYRAWPTDEARPGPLRRMESCSALGTPRPVPLAVGPEPPGQSIEHQLDTAGGDLGRLGYQAGKLVAFGALRSGQHAANGLLLTRQRCYALVAVGGDEIVDLDLRVFGPTLPLAAAGSDVSRSRAAQVKLCAEAPARYVVDVAAFQGEGAYAVAALELTEPAPQPGIAGGARIEYAELVARMHARGFDAQVLTSGVIDREEKLQVPLALAPGACLAIGALRSTEDPASSGLMLGLTAADGALLAMDGPSKEPPLLFHCAAQAERLQAMVGSAQGRGRARFALIVGREPAEGAP
jgi:hypothetical protein